MAKRRGHGEGSIYQRGDGKWCSVLNLGYVNGKRKRKTIYGKSRREVATKLTAMQVQQQTHKMVTRRSTVEEWLTHWLEHIAAERVRPTTLPSYRSKVTRYLIPALGRNQLASLEPVHVRHMYTDMRKRGLSEATLRQTHAILKRAIRDAMRDELVSRDVTELVDAPGTQKNTPTPLTVVEARKVLDAAKDTAREARWHVALYQGLRQGEALGLTWGDVNLDEGVLYVRQAIQRLPGQGLVLVKPKSAASQRRILLLPSVVAHLRVHWARQLRDGYSPHGYVFGRQDGRPYDPSADWSEWRALLDKADVRHVSLHAARNSAASMMLAAGVPDRIAAEILGHANVTITRNVYQRGDEVQHQAAVKALEAYVSDA